METGSGASRLIDERRHLNIVAAWTTRIMTIDLAWRLRFRRPSVINNHKDMTMTSKRECVT